MPASAIAPLLTFTPMIDCFRATQLLFEEKKTGVFFHLKTIKNKIVHDPPVLIFIFLKS